MAYSQYTYIQEILLNEIVRYDEFKVYGVSEEFNLNMSFRQLYCVELLASQNLIDLEINFSSNML